MTDTKKNGTAAHGAAQEKSAENFTAPNHNAGYPQATAAEFYASRGFAVFPLRPRSKAPATAHGKDDAKQADSGHSSAWGSFGLPDAPLVKAWAADFLDLPDIPTAGSTEWAALDDYDPAKLAAVVRAGVAWVTETAQLPQRLAEQLDAENRDLAERFKTGAQTVSRAVDWVGLSRRAKDRSDFIAENAWARRVAS